MTIARSPLVAGAPAAPPWPALAQDRPCPARPIRMFVNLPPGGTSDIAGRIHAERLQQRSGQPLPVGKRRGATLG
jgi:tripartite-type tricarboxylate transporter receptor subunit TctC